MSYVPAVVEFDYVVAPAGEWLESLGVSDDRLTFAARQYESGEYADSDRVAAWLADVSADGSVSGIYAEDGPVSVAMCNMDTLLDDDLSFTFANIGVADDDGEVWPTPVLVVHGNGYWLHRMADVDVYRLDYIDDDADVFGFTRGYAGHAGPECGAEWIIDDPCTLWPNGGGETVRIADAIVDIDGTPTLMCPECNSELHVMVG